LIPHQKKFREVGACRFVCPSYTIVQETDMDLGKTELCRNRKPRNSSSIPMNGENSLRL